jgi:hypothetical protein
MYKASNSSKCSETSVAETNKCLCSNGGNFVTNTAKCLGTAKNVKSSDIQTVYNTMKQACADSKTPLSVSEKAFLDAANQSTTTSKTTTRASTTTSTSSTSTSTGTTTESTPNPTGSKDPQNSQPEQENTGLSSGAKIGIIAGGAIAGIAVLAAVAILLLRRKRRKDGEESHPMLSQNHNYPTPGETVVVGHMHDMGRHSGAAWSDDAKWRPAGSPDPRNSTFNWETPYDPTGSPPIKQGFATPPSHQQGFPTAPPLHQGFPTPPPPLQQGFPAQQYKPYQPPLPSPQPMPAQPQVFELGSSQLPAEAPGSTIPVSTTAVEMEGTPAPPHGFEPRPQQSYPSQFGSGGYR